MPIEVDNNPHRVTGFYPVYYTWNKLAPKFQPYEKQLKTPPWSNLEPLSSSDRQDFLDLGLLSEQPQDKELMIISTCI